MLLTFGILDVIFPTTYATSSDGNNYSTGKFHLAEME